MKKLARKARRMKTHTLLYFGGAAVSQKINKANQKLLFKLNNSYKTNLAGNLKVKHDTYTYVRVLILSIL